MKITLRIWRQQHREDRGRMVTYHVDDISPDMSFLEMLDVLNEQLMLSGDEPVAFDSACREGICGACGLEINGIAHGPQAAIATCQLQMRSFRDGDVIEEIGFDGRGCAISQAATSMLSDLVKGKTASEVADLPKEALLDELGIPLTPVRLKCAILGLGVLKLALHKARGTPLPEEWGTSVRDLVLE